MRKVLFPLIILWLFSCQSNDKSRPQLEDNTFFAQRNGIKWSGKIDIRYNKEIRYNKDIDSLVILGINKVPYDEAVIVLKIKFEGEGQYSLKKKQALYYTTLGRDVIISRYRPASNSIGQVVITNYDQANKMLEGSFDVRLEKEWSYSQDDIDCISLTQGYFKGKIMN